MEPAEKCTSCGAALPKGFDPTCTRCGWDNRVGMRKCVSCKGGAISIHERPGYGPASGIAGVGGLVVWWILGLWLGGTAICLLGSVCALLTMVTLGYRCGSCGARADARVLSKEEKADAGKRRLGYLIGAVGLGIATVVIFVLGIALMAARMSR